MEKKRQIAAVLILLALIGVIAYRHSTGKIWKNMRHLFLMCLTTDTDYWLCVIKRAIFGTDVIDQRQVSIL